MKIVIVGAGFGGLAAAVGLSRRMRQLPDDTEVVVIDKKAHHVFTPLLYEVATAYIPNDRLDRQKVLSSVEAGAAIPYEWLFARLHDRVSFQKSEAERIDVVKKQVMCKNDTSISYDALVMAPGAITSDFGVQGVEEHALPLRTMEQARVIRARIERCVRQASSRPQWITVVGGGPVGIEFVAECAGLLRRLSQDHDVPHSISLRLLHAQDRLISMVHPALSVKALKRLESLGVFVQLNTRVVRVESSAVAASVISKDSAEKLSVDDLSSMRSDLTIWAAGNQACPLSQRMGSYVTHGKAGSLSVASTLEIQGLNDVFALGDIASVPAKSGTVHYGPMGSSGPSVDATVPWLAQSAMHQGDFLARNLSRWLWDRPLMTYSPPSVWPSAFPLGGKYGLFEWRSLRLSGRLGFWARSLADVDYFRRVLPPKQALKHWRSGYKVYQGNN